MTNVPTRRGFLQAGAAGATTLLLQVGCRPKVFVCNDAPNLSPEESSGRGAVNYSDVAPDPAKDCSKCRRFVAGPSNDSCGTCQVVKGPIHPKGTCRVFSGS